MRVLVCLLLLSGCNDDRKQVMMDVFFCNPNSHTADYDCGDGYTCYTAAQSVGDSFCVRKCDPKNAKKSCPEGQCTRAGECLPGCDVDNDRSCPAGDRATICVRTTYSPIEQKEGKDGVCLPVASSCSESSECLGSPIFNLCTSDTNGQNSDPSLARNGGVCSQGFCHRDGVACQPGSTCIKNVLGAGIEETPDVCTPNCQAQPNDMGPPIFQCVVGFTCLNEAFPQTTTRVCAPGKPGWLCPDSLSCVAGSCEKWDSLGSPFEDFQTCAPKCVSDDDCRVYDHRVLPGVPNNPQFFINFTCVKEHCRNLQSLFFSELCLPGNNECKLDSQATCETSDGGAAGLCVHHCQKDAECDDLSRASHVKHSCDPTSGACAPAIPFLTACTDDASCVEGLSCQATPLGNRCTRTCDTNADCAAHDLLSTNFACALPLHLCVPKYSAGESTPSEALCLSGKAENGICKSPIGWACDAETQCLSGKCACARPGCNLKRCL